MDFTHSLFRAEAGRGKSRGFRFLRGLKNAAPARASRNSGRAASAGAVRLNAEPEPSFSHSRKLTAALVAVAGGILWTTSSTGTVEEAPPAAISRIATVLKPTFFFDDSSDALSNTGNTHFFKSALPGVADHSEHQVKDSAAQLAAELPLFGELDALTPDGRQDAPRTVTVSTLVNHPALKAVKDQAESPTGANKTVVKVASGNTLSGILNDHGVKIEHMPQLLTDDIVKKHLSNLKIGQELFITQLPNGDFHSLSTKVGQNKRITVRRSANDFAVASIDLPVEKERVVTSGTI